jgi:uncharacterized Zn-finger protein
MAKPTAKAACRESAGRYDPAAAISEPDMPVEVPEIIEVDTTRVSCEGIGGALGHPKVYLEMGDKTFVECPYCDRRFVLKDGAGHH